MTMQSGEMEQGGLRRSVKEVLIVALGILCAFGIDAWWDASREAAETRQFLVALEAEFSANVAALRATAARQHEIVAAGQILLQLTGPEAGPTAIQAAAEPIGTLWTPGYQVMASGALNTLIASGGLARVDDAALRGALGRWPEQLAKLMDLEDETWRIVTEMLQPRMRQFVPQLEIELASGFASLPGVRQEFLDAAPRSSPFEADYSGLLADMQFESAVVQRITMTMIVAHVIETETLPLAGEILRGLRARIE